MEKKFIVGLDGGTQSSKVVVFDLKGNIICRAQEKLKPMSMPRAGVAEHPDDDLWDSLCVALRQVMESFPYDRKSIIGVGLCSIRCCRALLDAEGKLLSPIISWMDQRLRSAYQNDDPRIKYVTTATGYLTVRLTGEFKDTTANYRGPWPMDYARWDWLEDEQAFNAFNVRRDMLLDLVKPGDVLGYVTEDAAEATGLPKGIPVVATANDKAVEALGAGLADGETTGLISLGTLITSMIPGNAFLPPKASFWTNHACMPFRFLHESQSIPRGMSTISWFKELIGEGLTESAKAMGISPEEYLEIGAREVPAGSLGLFTIPRWLTFDNPPFGRGIMIGFEGRHTRDHMYRSILEGIAYTIYLNMQAMLKDLDRHVDQLTVSGGGSNSDLFMQIIADVFGMPVQRNQMNESVSLGSAISVAVGLGVYPDYRTAIAHMVKKGDTFIADGCRHKLYQQLIEEVYRMIPIVNEGIQRKSYGILYE